MKNMKHLKNDVVLCLLLILVGVALWLCLSLSEGGGYVTVSLDGEEVARYDLHVDGCYDVTSGDYHLTLTVKDGSVRVTDADCPDRICEKSGAISKAGQSIVCLPARIVIRVVGEGEVDAYA